ncbi:protein TIFY 5A-like isoform X2 [Mangifera indica]|uniref:protein TIFY 5A-like isoform X2 n=1 Tax=Mangifera indica TaxID=29780 RepID=UPI001CF95528|nr:protein TIFY 5A-like isoform X2 [Mangifera indica]
MKRNCNLELCLLPSSSSSSAAASEPEYGHPHHLQNMDQESSSSQHSSQPSQQLTIFYNGRVCVCDVTEFQARNILLLASREMEERVKTATGSERASPPLPCQLYRPSSSTSGLSMKRSLQRFLQKRKHRALASPYGH